MEKWKSFKSLNNINIIKKFSREEIIEKELLENYVTYIFDS